MDSIGPMLDDLLYNSNTGNLESKIGTLYYLLTLVNLTTNIGISFEIKTVDSNLPIPKDFIFKSNNSIFNKNF